jgi:hypothetical protein
VVPVGTLNMPSASPVSTLAIRSTRHTCGDGQTRRNPAYRDGIEIVIVGNVDEELGLQNSDPAARIAVPFVVQAVRDSLTIVPAGSR